ncbi:hypothetical protein [Acholeplasma laidlawii]|jgi:hypothetical protein|uniref:Uncharacterized protein n=1 Tax=Acholeplasma laidlawii (strain PG-8A) TaxID=441768 RepID=A9NDZ9_ACHLI|nr:hypothetical protein [Acholeplasma laidlawii]ABX81959.1 hypothetical protein ACL_1367 [Acholeplasma laidlawii PG-8A]NWH10941.1 hypothetical protein [Acholeplasma laidlawii]NWH12327.1 hypothetical protein [Acholeplasma laidlawii]NWH13713.1 hypothetical protein [Acholeplasma laidlawii]NWH15042.1 hypothetical protein [Acholeplasma laidlawii]
MKSFLKFLVEPIRYLGSRGFAETVVKFFDRHEWLIYVVAFIVTVFIMFMIYVQPVL